MKIALRVIGALLLGVLRRIGNPHRRCLARVELEKDLVFEPVIKSLTSR